MAEIPLTWRGVSLLRRVLIITLLAFTFAPPAGAATQTLLPGLTYTRQLLFTPHGPVVEHVLVGTPRFAILANFISTGCEEVAIATDGASADAQQKFVQDFVAAWNKAMNLDRFDLR